jgi:hypothetical protein
METHNCNLAGCKNQSKFIVRFAFASNATHPPAISSPVLYVCPEHMDVEWKDVCDDNGWNQICSQFTGKGLSTPSKEFSYIEIVPITA